MNEEFEKWSKQHFGFDVLHSQDVDLEDCWKAATEAESNRVCVWKPVDDIGDPKLNYDWYSTQCGTWFSFSAKTKRCGECGGKIEVKKSLTHFLDIVYDRIYEASSLCDELKKLLK